jgi:site-specific DNA-methyltransferase (adenine-specific)
VSDPPYLINFKSNSRRDRNHYKHIEGDVDGYQLIRDYFIEAKRILKNNTAIYKFCSWYHVVFSIAEFEKDFKLKNIIFWNKNNGGMGDLHGSYSPKPEFILFGHKGRSLNRGKCPFDVIDCPKVYSNTQVHPTEKPVEMLVKLILNIYEMERDGISEHVTGVPINNQSTVSKDNDFIPFKESNIIHRQIITLSPEVKNKFHAIYPQIKR